MLIYIINNAHKKIFLLFNFVLFFNFIKAQDTIFTKEPQTLLVKVIEISQSEVIYKNYINPDGILRKIGSQQVVKIVYENGKTESKFQIRQKTSDTSSIKNLFVVEERHIAYDNKDITHALAYKIMMKKDYNSNSEELNDALINADSKRNGQIAFNIIAPVTAVGGAYFALQHRYNTPQQIAIKRTLFFGGLSACAVSIITAQIYKAIKNKHIRKAALLYNKEFYN